MRLPAVWPFGEAGAALRFAELLAAALAGAPVAAPLPRSVGRAG